MSEDAEARQDSITIYFRDDTIELFGMTYTLDLFRVLAFLPVGRAFRVVGRENGIVSVQTLPDTLSGDVAS